MRSIRSRHGGGQAIIGIIAIICIVIGVIMVVKRLKQESTTTVGNAYYYCEDCKSEFVAPGNQFPPIKCPKCGQVTAVRAVKYKGKDGKVFTGYYEEYDPESKRLLEALKRGEKVDQLKIRSLLVRTPDGEWADSSTQDGFDVFNSVTSPTDGSTGEELERVYPESKKK